MAVIKNQGFVALRPMFVECHHLSAEKRVLRRFVVAGQLLWVAIYLHY